MPRVKKQFKTIHKQSDKEGNFFIVDEEPVYGNWKLYIHLNGEPYRRMMGEIDTQNRTLFIKRDKGKHLHNMMKSYGFNYKIVNDIVDLQNILMLEKDGDHLTYYKIPVQFIRENGVKKNFVKAGIELQYMLRVEYLERFKTTAHFEKGRLTE